MQVKHYTDAAGILWREIIDKSASALKELKLAYTIRGRRCWLNPYDATRWVLTVEIGEARRVA